MTLVEWEENILSIWLWILTDLVPLGEISSSTQSVEKKETSIPISTGPDGAVVMANGLVGTRFTSRYRLQPRAGF